MLLRKFSESGSHGIQSYQYEKWHSYKPGTEFAKNVEAN